MAARAGRPTDPSGNLGDVLDLLAALLAASMIAFVRLGAPGIPRALLALGFAIFVPGRAIITNWPRLGRWSEAAMSVVFSLALLILVTTVALWVRYWHPLGLTQVLAVLSLGGLAAGVRRRRRDRKRAGSTAPAAPAISQRPDRLP